MCRDSRLHKIFIYVYRGLENIYFSSRKITIESELLNKMLD